MFNNSKKLIIGSRSSLLARKQVDIFMNQFLEKNKNSSRSKLEKLFIKTKGDIRLDKKISQLGNKGLFTKEIDVAQLEKKIDVSIHSLKDLPYKIPNGLIIAGYLKREDFRDAIVGNKKLDLITLKKNAVVGTSSIRREIQLLKVRPDIKIKLIRGNVETRIKKVKEGKFDATLLAMAGLRRLDISDNITPLEISNFVPAVGQGAIAIIARQNDEEIINLIKNISDIKTEVEVSCEREFLRGIDGSCKTPVGGLAIYKKSKEKSNISFHYFSSNPNGKKIRKGIKVFDINLAMKECYFLGKKLNKMLY